MRYGDLATHLTGIATNCRFIYPSGDHPSVINEDNLGCSDTTFGTDKVEDFERKRLGSAGFHLKSWSDLTVSERKELMDYLGRLDHADSEVALAVDLILYTMDAPGYRDPNRLSPSRLNRTSYWDQTAGTYAWKREKRGYKRAFEELRAKVDQEAQMDPNLEDENGWTVLMTAIQTGDNQRVKALLESGAKVDAETKALYELNANGTGFERAYDAKHGTLTPLIIAVRLGNLEAVNLLLQHGADVNQQDSTRKTALNWVEECIEAARDENSKNNFIAIREALRNGGRQENLIDAIRAGDSRRVDALIKSGANVNEQTTEKYDVVNGEFVVSNSQSATTLTPLILAARYGNKGIVEKLLEAGAQVSQKDSSGRTALDWVNERIANESDRELRDRFEGIKRVLMAHSQPAPVNVDDAVRRFLDATKAGRTDEALNILNQYKDNPSFLNWKNQDNNPLWVDVFSSKQSEVIKAFVATNVDLTVKGLYDQTPMHYALWYDQGALLSVLKDKGFDVNVRDNGQQTPLHQIYWGETSVQTIELFIEAGAEVNSKDCDGNTPLDLVYDELNALVAADGGISPENLAKFKSYIEVLRKHGATNAKVQLSPEAQRALGMTEPAPANVDDAVRRFLDATKAGRTDEALNILNQYKDNSSFLNWKNQDNNPLWTDVFSSKQSEVIKAFVATNVDLTVKDSSGQTPMHYALCYDQGALLSVLKDKGFDINARDNNQETALHRICDGLTSVGTIELFIEAGAEVNSKNKDGFTPLDLVYKELNALVDAGGGISPENLAKFKSYIEVLRKHGATNEKVQLSAEAQKALGLTEPQPQKPTLEEFFAELRKEELELNRVKELLTRGAGEYINEFDPAQNVPTSGMVPLSIAVARGDIELLNALIEHKADVNKASKDGQTPLQLALQKLEEAKQTEDQEKIKAAQAIVDRLKEAGAKEEEREDPVAEVDTLARKEGEPLSEWYKRVATYWGEQEGALRAKIAAEQDQERKATLTAQADAQSKLATMYAQMADLEAQLATETDPNKKREILGGLVKLSMHLKEDVPNYYNAYHAEAMKDAQNPYTQQRNNQQEVLMRASDANQKELTALLNSRGSTDRPPQDSGNTPETPGSDNPGTSVDVGTTPTPNPTSTDVTPAVVDAVANAKHDGAQEKSWWERNQEWIWWVLGIILVAVLGYFGFRKGGWFNKDDKKTETPVNSNTNENTNSNTNTGTDNNNSNSGTGNDNTNSDTGNGTLANSGQLYSSQEVNSAIASNAHNVYKDRL